MILSHPKSLLSLLKSIHKYLQNEIFMKYMTLSKELKNTHCIKKKKEITYVKSMIFTYYYYTLNTFIKTIILEISSRYYFYT